MVSIPYSSIKRAPRRAKRPFKLVSIPYSSIKSQYAGTAYALGIAFQFHIVRLKEPVSLNEEHVGLFQFHIVRLKVFFCHDCSSFNFMFQFHIVRLKVTDYAQIANECCKFQFHIVRLKDMLMQRFRDAGLFQFHIVRLKGFNGFGVE